MVQELFHFFRHPTPHPNPKSEKNDVRKSGVQNSFWVLRIIFGLGTFSLFSSRTHTPTPNPKSEKMMSEKVGCKIRFGSLGSFLVQELFHFSSPPPPSRTRNLKKKCPKKWDSKFVLGSDDHFWFRNFFTFFIEPHPPIPNPKSEKMMSVKVGCKIRFGSWGSFLVYPPPTNPEPEI